MNCLNKVFLDPRKPLVNEVVAWLLGDGRFEGKSESVDGATSLSHIMVVVPTAQSGRNLRLALARRGGVLLPPKVVLPMQLVKPAAPAFREASDAEVAAAFLKFLEDRPRRQAVQTPRGAETVLAEWRHLFRPEVIGDMGARLSLLDQLSDIWRILAGGGMVMADVLASDAAREVLDAAAGEEVARWEELAVLEQAFFAFLHARGICHPAENMRLAKTKPRPIDPGIREVVLPALADPIRVLKDVLSAQRPELKVTVLLHADEKDAAKFDAFGRPLVEQWTGKNQPALTRLDTTDIIRGADTADMARRVVADFPAVEDGRERPSLALVDDEAFPEVSGAFLNAGYVVHNPECHPLSISSLGRLVRVLFDLYRPDAAGYAWTSFAAALRSDDVLKALVAEGGFRRADVLKGIDVVQNRFLPQHFPVDGVLPDVAVSKYDQPGFAAFSGAAKRFIDWLDAARAGRPLTAFLRQMLRRVFARRRLSGRAGEDEFREAAACLWTALDALESEAIAAMGLSDAAFGAVVRRQLDAAVYSLEPEALDAVKTEGWLELPWSAARRFALVGFHEGAVPDSLVGHPFVPDALRAALGLTTNEDRLARDTWLLKELLDSHDEHGVRAYIAKTNGAGDICRPSRLLYLCPPAAFPARVGYLFGDCDVEEERFPRQVADRWRLRLPDEVALPSRDERTPQGRLSASALDQYVRCPFTYLLKYALGMKKVEEKRELGFDDFGTLVHKVLEAYATEQIARGDDQLTDAAAIRAALERIAQEVVRAYGARPSVNVALQLDALVGRLGLFADIQAQWAADGWRIVARPEYPFLVQPFLDAGDATWIKGSIDRIDCHPEHGYRLIDYKTWDRKGDIVKHIVQGGAAQQAFAERQHFPLLPDGRRWMSVQLPLYARCLAEADAAFRGRVADMCYLVLGEDAANMFVFGSAYPQGRFEAQAQKKIVLADLAPTALETARVALRHIRENLFWPPGPGEEWKHDFKGLFVTTPEKDMGEDLKVPPEWLRTQMERLEACK